MSGTLGDPVRHFADCREAGADLVGGKAYGLGHLTALGLPVPPGFALTTDAYREHLAAAGLLERVAALADGAVEPAAQAIAAREIEELFLASSLSGALQDAVHTAYRELGDEIPVAVRSSADAEDTADASFAGQQESYLWVRGAEAVTVHVRRCWASLFTPQAIAYRADRGIRSAEVAMGVVIQQMIPASVAGVMMTLDPVTGDRSQVTIEAAYGLGLGVVSGEVTPDRFAIDKVALCVRERVARDKRIAFAFDPDAGEVRPREVAQGDRERLCVHDDELLALTRIGKDLERELGVPQDVEWALGPGEPGAREVHLLQTRPETVWTKKARAPIAPAGSSPMERMIVTMRTPVRLRG